VGLSNSLFPVPVVPNSKENSGSAYANWIDAIQSVNNRLKIILFFKV
jgi:hypothetical protein